MWKYKNLILSLLFLVLTIGSLQALFEGSQIFDNQPFALTLIPAFDLFAIYFAVRGMKRNESPLGTYIGILGIILFIIILLIATVLVRLG